MPCYSPLKGYYSRDINSATGKRSIVFSVLQALDDRSINLPCGQCIGCRLERSRQWAIRCVHEASLYENNCFLTLTYDQEHLPKNNTLVKKHFQDFMKRLRERNSSSKIRYFHCGEYGEKFQRPHYHACLFNFDFNDKKIFKIQNNVKIYTSEKLEKVWQKGFCTIGDVTFESAAYVARYITKKITGSYAPLYYNKINHLTGEIIEERIPEYTTMSRRPGIGQPWLDKYMTDVYPHDFVVVRGKKIRAPKYYDKQHAKNFPFEHDLLLEDREKLGKSMSQNSTSERLRDREEIKLQQIEVLKRSYENEM